jgi:hypothetical protein
MSAFGALEDKENAWEDLEATLKDLLRALARESSGEAMIRPDGYLYSNHLKNLANQDIRDLKHLGASNADVIDFVRKRSPALAAQLHSRGASDLRFPL